MSNENKWRKTPENPNIDNTEAGKLLENLRILQAHYEGKLQEDLGNLASLQQALAKWELQKRKRKVDPNG